MATWMLVVILLMVNTTLINCEQSLDIRFKNLEDEFGSILSELRDTRAKLDSVETKLDDTRSHLRHTQTELQMARSDIQSNKDDLQLTRTELQWTQSELQTTRAELKITRSELQTILSYVTATNTDSRTANVKHFQDAAERTKLPPNSDFEETNTELLNNGVTNPEATPYADVHTSNPTKSQSQLCAHLLRDRRVLDGQETAFSSRLFHDNKTYVTHQTVMFDYTILNEGNAYDSHTGIFTCPGAGVYFFSVTIMAAPNKQMELDLVINGREVIFIHAGGGHLEYNQGTNSVVVRLEAGDRVWVWLHENKVFHVGEVRIVAYFSTFTGFKI